MSTMQTLSKWAATPNLSNIIGNETKPTESHQVPVDETLPGAAGVKQNRKKSKRNSKRKPKKRTSKRKRPKRKPSKKGKKCKSC
jgi:hypothetical protein